MFFAVSCALLVGFFGVVYWWAASAFPWIATHKKSAAIAVAAFVAVHLATRWMVILWHSGLADGMHTILDVFAMTLGIAALPLAMLRAVVWIVSRPSRPARDDGVVPAAGVTRRRAVEQIGGLTLLGASGMALGWGTVRGRHMFELTELPVQIPGLPRALDGYVIAQISDVHAGEHVGDRLVAEGLDVVRRARPDLIVVTGDAVDFDASYAPSLARKLADLPSRDGVSAILGDHDYYAGADSVVAALRAAGIDVMINQGKLIRAGDGGGFALLGVDDRWAKRYRRPGPDLHRTLAAVPSHVPRILLSHQPATVDSWAGQVALQLSGHTHGGRNKSGLSAGGAIYRYVAGLYEVGGTTLYVNRGFGTVGPPSRVGAPPEITRIVLVAG